MSLKEKRNLYIFIAVVIASGWLGLAVDQVLPNQPEGNSLGMGLWLVLPLITVVLLRIIGKEGWKGAGLALHLKQGWVWYIVALLIYPIITALILLLGKLRGWINVDDFSMNGLVSAFFSVIIVLVIKNVFEEFVWRGYLTAKLLKLKANDWSLYCITGLVWGMWHIPYYLFFLPDETMASVLPVSKVLFTLIAIISMVAWTVMFVELFRLTNSIWPAVLMHAVEDALLNTLVIDGYIAIERGKEIWISPICGIITSLLYVGVGLSLRAARLKRG